MEHGTKDLRSSTFCLTNEDHTLANSVRFTLNQDSWILSSLYSFNLGVHALCNSLKNTKTLSLYTAEEERKKTIPRVSFCGYSIPHPADAQVNIRVQTTGDPAREVMKDALEDLVHMCDHVSTTFDKAVVDFKMSAPVKAMNIEP